VSGGDGRGGERGGDGGSEAQGKHEHNRRTVGEDDENQ